MWLLRTEESAPSSFSYRILPGHAKTLGRATNADFIVDASRVSRLHCRLTAGAAELEVIDLDSTNGTYVNGRRIDRAVLQSGDRLGIGEVELVVVKS